MEKALEIDKDVVQVGDVKKKDDRVFDIKNVYACLRNTIFYCLSYFDALDIFTCTSVKLINMHCAFD